MTQLPKSTAAAGALPMGEPTQEHGPEHPLLPPTKPIGLVGLGTMGAPLARRLLDAGYPVGVFNRTYEKTVALEKAGATGYPTVAQLARDCDILVLVLSDDASVQEVILDAQGVAAGAQRGMVVINCSTVSPQTNQDLAEALAPQGVELLDAPLSGSRRQAETGQVFFLVGGNRSTYEACIPLLEVLGRGHLYLGQVGTGSSAKLANNLLGLITLAGLVEALQLVERCGLSVEKYLPALAHSGARSVLCESKGSKIAREDWSPDFSLTLAVKDLRLACDLARKVCQQAPILEQTCQIYARAAEEFGELDVGVLKRWYELLERPPS